ncbi:MAG: hypothetical protein DRP01_05650 [Archaeoglobales archaeon]|nr:MAG: hypothetical protein DRP01_05650 [Archaeoglobales archaeon]
MGDKMNKGREYFLTSIIIFIFLIGLVSIPSLPLFNKTVKAVNVDPTYTEGFEDGDYDGWLVTYVDVHYPLFRITTTAHSGSYALNLTDYSTAGTDRAPQVLLTKGFPQSGQTNFTESVWFMVNIDLTKVARVYLVLGANETTALYGAWSVENGLEIGLVTYADVAPVAGTVYREILTNKSYSISNNTWYKLEVVWTIDNQTQVRLYDSTNTLLANTSYINIPTGWEPTAQGFGMHGGAGQLGSFIFDDYSITWESSDVTYHEPVVILSPTHKNPDLGTHYDWVGAPYIARLQNGTWLMTVRWHGEYKSTDGSGTGTDQDGSGERIDLYKSDDGFTWTFVKTLFYRTDFGWNKMEKAALVVLPNGTWLCYVAAADSGQPWEIELLRSNDEGSTWVNVTAVITGATSKKYPHPYLLPNGTLLMAYGYVGVVHNLTRSNDYVNFEQIKSFPSDWECVTFMKASDGWYYVTYHEKYTSSDYVGVPALPRVVRTKDFDTYQDVNLTILDFGPYLTLTLAGMFYSVCIEINNQLYLYGESHATDHDYNDDITDRTQRHLIRIKDPVATTTIPSVNASIVGTLTVGYAAPEVLDIKIYNTTWYEVSSIDPYTEYWLNMTIRHNNTLYSLKNITIYFYASGYSWDSADDPNTHATFLWDNSTKEYSLIGPTGTTWGVNTANCRVPDQSQNTGTFTLAFNASKIALMGTWYVNVTAWGAQDLSDNLTISFTVNFYAEINLTDTSFEFDLATGTVNGTLSVPADGNINFTIICNAPYNISFYTNDNWTSNGNEIDITNTNYFIGDDDADPADTTEGGTIPEFAIHPTPDKTTPYSNVAVTQDDINGDAYAIYLFQTVPEGTPTGTYTIILYIEVTTA